MPSHTRVNGFLIERELAHRIIAAVARHDARHCTPGIEKLDAQVRDEIDRLATGGHAQAASRALVASLKGSPEAMAYLAKKLAEAV
jgi:hypothetical protein